MRCVIRNIIHVGDAVEYRDEELNAESLSIGRSLDQDVVLPGSSVGLRHASLVQLRNDAIEIRCVANNEIRVNDELIESRQLLINDIVSLGQNKMKVIPSPSGFDIAFELELQQTIEDEPDYEAKFKTDLKLTSLNKRRMSWILGLIFLFAGLLIPLVVTQLNLQDSMISNFLVTDTFWKSGPLIDAHRAELENKCTTCHEAAFQMVRNSACEDCHKTITRHATIEHPLTKELDQRRCASCHKEHNEPGTIIYAGPQHCSDCHAVLDQKLADKQTLQNVKNFDKDHPNFIQKLLVEDKEKSAIKNALAGKQPWKRVRDKKSSAKLIEQSNLKFDHKVHMDPGGLESPSGSKKLICESCHVLDAAGLATLPVSMDNHCEECHQLSFDPRAGDFKLPHGSVEQVIYVLEGFYQGSNLISPMNIAKQVTNGNDNRRRKPRRPGQRQDETTDFAKSDPGQSLNSVVKEVFERTTCVICHVVERGRG